LIVEKSVVNSIFINTRWSYCNFCLNHCASLVPCTKCGDVGLLIKNNKINIVLGLCMVFIKLNAYFDLFQTMYCSKKCRNSDWSSAHKSECNKISFVTPLGPFKLDESPDQGSHFFSIQSTLIHLIAYIGLKNIKKTVLENKPMLSLMGDPRTKGFQDGIFETATLEAILSLEDNFDKLTSEEIHSACKQVISSKYLNK
jgi:hypothetical protein